MLLTPMESCRSTRMYLSYVLLMSKRPMRYTASDSGNGIGSDVASPDSRSIFASSHALLSGSGDWQAEDAARNTESSRYETIDWQVGCEIKGIERGNNGVLMPRN